MKNKKGFTLIELLAIIVILAIIAVITVPIILNIIDNSKKGAATDSAYGFKDAIRTAYINKLSTDSDYNITDGTYTVSDLKTQIGLSVSGKEPSSNSWIEIEKNNIIAGCLQYDDYKVEMVNGQVSDTVKGTCSSSGTWDMYYTSYVYNSGTGEDYKAYTDFDESWNAWLQLNTTTGEKQTCTRFPGGTVCMENVIGGYDEEFGEFTDATLNGYILEKKNEIESKGGTCTLRTYNNKDYFDCRVDELYHNEGCSIVKNGSVQCEDTIGYRCTIYSDGTFDCD